MPPADPLPSPPPEAAGDALSSPRSQRKREAIVKAATEVFLRNGYLGTNMDEIAALSSVSKQTVYKHFSSKEALFIEIVTGMTGTAGDRVQGAVHLPGSAGEIHAFLLDYANRQLAIVLTPRLMQLRRLVIGEVPRFPDLARVLYERGPGRALGMLADTFSALAARGWIEIADPVQAAAHFNWLVMSDALNRVMLLGDDALPAPEKLKRDAEEGVRVFLAAYPLKG